MSLEQQLDRAHRNLHLFHLDKISRRDFKTFEELLELGQEREITSEQMSSYKVPPPVDKFLLGNAAFKNENPEKSAPIKKQNNIPTQQTNPEVAATTYQPKPQNKKPHPSPAKKGKVNPT